MALKLDMNKVYDRVEWEFLADVMRKMSFNEKWVQWIMECISSVSYKIIVNSKNSNTIFPNKGLRQGDILSLYLFLFVIDVLSRMVNKALESRCLAGLKVSRECPIVSHLLFAGDSYFLPANVRNCDAIRKIL